MTGFIDTLSASLSDNSFIRLSLGHYKGPDDSLKKISVRKIVIKGDEALSFTYSHQTRDIVKNFNFADAVAELGKMIGVTFHSATLHTTGFDLVFETFKDGKTRIRKKKASINQDPPLSHNREKNRLIQPSGQSYLHDLKITDAKGDVYKNAQDKFRQINKYIEILDGLFRNIPPEKIKKIADMGSGKGYLTFALYDYLKNTVQIDAAVTGVEYRADMVKLCNEIAGRAGFEKLSFVKGAIGDYDGRDTNVMIALHACDTATDDAIYKGIEAGAELIVVAPCCHKQIRREIERHRKKNDLDFVTKHGIFMEREAEMVTDALRALMLEYCGYATKVFEFISDAHTPKNVLIVATKKEKGPVRPPALLQKIKDAKAYFGIESHHLERLLGI